ncbi:MAG: hypothetical protein L0211_16820 [Planctomycetaceae bacterium]|nr:hypothetical protein [Planctomycetaceae bacterium]
MQLVISTDGTARCLYSEAIDLHLLGTLDIRRGSHVEPIASGRWCVDLSPVGGPLLVGFSSRSQALAAEEAWLLAHWLAR